MRFSALLLILVVIVVALLPGRPQQAVRAQDSVKKAPVPLAFGPAQKFANAKQRIISPGDETNLTMAMSPQQSRRRRGPRLPLAPVPGSAMAYLVLSIEFESATSLAGFRVPGVTVFAQRDKFADVFVERKQAVLDQLRQAPGIVWIEESAAIEAPPPPARPRPLRKHGARKTLKRLFVVAWTGSPAKARSSPSSTPALTFATRTLLRTMPQAVPSRVCSTSGTPLAMILTRAARAANRRCHIRIAQQ
jgi:hypothetical protein